MAGGKGKTVVEEAILLIVEKREEEEEEKEGFSPLQAVDWLWRPPSRLVGGWRPSVFILGSMTLDNIAISGITINLVLYLIRVWDQSNAQAANAVTNWIGTLYIASFIGAILSDAYFGRIWTCVLCQLILLVGLILISLSATLDSLMPSQCTNPLHICTTLTSASSKLFFFFSLYMVAIGAGSYQPIAITLGADQLDSPIKKSLFVNLFLASTNFGMIISSTIISYIQNQGQWALGFWLCAGAGVCAFLNFLVGMPSCYQYRIRANPLSRIAQVIVAACRKWHVKVPTDSALLFETPEQEIAMQGHHKILHSEVYRWLDRAATITENDKTPNPWRLCTVSQVEEMKCICRIMPIWICGTLVNCVMAQMSTLFTEQGDTMDNSVGSFKVPPASMSLFSVCSVIMGALVYSWIVSPFVRQVRSDKKDLTPLQRIGIGIVISMAGMSAAALVEMTRLSLVSDKAVSMSIFWLVPQYVLQGWAQFMFFAGHIDFNYTEASDALRSIATAISLSSYAIGNYMSSILISAITGITSRGGSPGWIPKNLNEGHLDYFYWFLVAFLGFTMLLFLLFAHWHKYVKVHNNKPIEDITSRLTNGGTSRHAHQDGAPL